MGWETFASVYDIFGGGTPRAWAELDRGPRIVEGTSAVIHQNLVDYRQADHNWLTDQDRNPAPLFRQGLADSGFTFSTQLMRAEESVRVRDVASVKKE